MPSYRAWMPTKRSSVGEKPGHRTPPRESRRRDVPRVSLQINRFKKRFV